MKRIALPCLLSLAGVSAAIPLPSPSAAAESLERGFADVPDQYRPWCYWWWINGHADRKTITADLEAMKRIGFGGVLHFDSRGYWDDDNHLRLPPAEIGFMSEEWQDLIVHAIREAARLGLEFSMNMSSSGGKLDGPWPVGADAPKRLVYRFYPAGAEATDVPDLPHYRDVATLDVWYRGPAIADFSGWRNGGDGIFTMDAGARDRRLDAHDDAVRTLADPHEPGARRVRIRFGHAVMDGHDHDVDVLDPQAVAGHFRRFQGALLSRVPDLVGRGKTLTHLYSVSWEGSMPTWTGNFIAEFKRLAGCDIVADLPLLAGFRHRDAAYREEFVRAYRRARNDMFRENFYGTMRKLANARNIGWYSESGGPWSRKAEIFREADQIGFLAANDMPQGEFWPLFLPSADNIGNYHVRGAVAAAHLYGLPRVSAEAFTHMRYHWSIDPARLKGVGDLAFSDGVNHFVWHTFTCSPDRFGVPGIEYFAGTHINRNVTWHPAAGGFLAYLARCQYLLQQGVPQTDYAVYSGSTPYQHWGRFRDRPYAGSQLRLPSGYTYDLVNDDAILSGARLNAAKRIEFPGGVSYGALVVDLEAPERGVRPEVAAKFAEWKRQGLPVLSAAEFARGMPASLSLPDFAAEGNFSAAHRWLPDTGEHLYFVCGSGRTDALFRASAPAVELWDAVDGSRRRASAEQMADGRTRVALELPENGSVFVVFRRSSSLPCVPESRPAPKPVAGEWLLIFGDARNLANPAPDGIRLAQLADWTELPQLRHFSGTGEYRIAVELTAAEAAEYSRIALGRLPSGLATVAVNGEECGTVWCAPWETAARFRPGRNEIAVRVTNNWRNLLIGDAALPPERRLSRSNLQFWDAPRGGDTNNLWTVKPRVWSGYTTKDPLEPSGLLGPVTLR